MTEIVEICRENALEFADFLGAGSDPTVLFDNTSSYKHLALGIRVDGNPTGAARGVVPADRPLFFSLDRVCLEISASELLGTLACELKSRLMEKGVRQVALRYSHQGAARSTLENLYEGFTAYFAEEYSVHKRDLNRTYLGLSSRIPELKRHRWFDTQRIPEGFRVLMWKDFSETEKKSLHHREMQKHEEQKDYLSPFFPEPYDERTSLVVVDHEHDEVAGWVITGELDPSTILIRRFFIHPRYRHLLLGPAVASRVLILIMQYYRRFGFKVVAGNRSMQAIAEKYFDPVMDWQVFQRQFDMIKK